MSEQRRSDWLFEIDVIKAVCIVTVVMIHALDGWSGQATLFLRMLKEWAGFAVPLFLLTAGFLFDKTHTPTRSLLRKMSRRILVPYLVCSIIMLLFRATWLFEPRLTDGTPRHLLLLFLTGRTLGIYYFVALLVGLQLFSLWLRRWSPRWIFVLWLALGVRWFVSGFGAMAFRGRVGEILVVGAFCYLGGWLLALHYSAWRPHLRRWSVALVLAAFTVELIYFVYLLQVADPGWLHPLATGLHYLAIFTGLLVAGLRWPSDNPVIHFLSRSSYAIYLLHFPLVRAVQYIFVPGRDLDSSVALLLPWAVGLIGTVLLVLALQKALGPRSRLLIGA